MSWKTVKLGEVCKMYQPKTIASKNLNAEGKYPVYGANGVIGRYDNFNHEESQLLITCRGATCGSVNISQPFSWINGNAMVIQPDQGLITTSYIEYVFRGGIDLAQAITGAAQPQITRTSLNPIIFSYPPLAEQERIVAKLDAAFAAIDQGIALAEKKEAEVEQLKAALLSASLAGDDWKTVKLGEVCKTGAGGTPLKSNKRYYEGGDINWLLSGAVCEKEIFASSTFISQEGLNNSSAKIFPPNTILIAMYGATAGQVSILKVQAATNQAVCGIYPCNDYLPQFIYYFFLNYKDTLLKEVSGVAQPNLSQVKIKNVQIPLPPLAEQERIVAKLDAAFGELETARTAIAETKANYQALKAALLAQELQPKENEAA